MFDLLDIRLRSVRRGLLAIAVAAGCAAGAFAGALLNDARSHELFIFSALSAFAGLIMTGSVGILIVDRPLRLTVPLLAGLLGALAFVEGWIFPGDIPIYGVMIGVVALAFVVRGSVVSVLPAEASCRKCGHDLIALPPGRCPECGEKDPIPTVVEGGSVRAATTRPRLLWGTVAALCLLLVATPFLAGRVFESDVHRYDRLARSNEDRRVREELRTADRAVVLRVMREAASAETRKEAVGALWLRGDQAAVAEAMADPDADVRTYAAIALAEMRRPSLDQLTRDLRDAETSEERQAARMRYEAAVTEWEAEKAALEERAADRE